MTSIIPIPVPISSELEKSISSFSPSIANFLTEVGLPTENILSSVDERKKVIFALAEALSILPIEEREKATYLTKFTVAIAVGLFDGALNYLWDETISSLRRLAAKFDLEYFFSIAEKVSSRNKNFSTTDDLDRVDDHDLLETCRRIGLISDVNYKRLDNVNFMRNHASAAHPNENEIDGYEMLAWLSNCLRYAIMAEPNHDVISITKLLTNVRTEVIPADDFPIIGSEIEKLPQERVDDLLWALFGIYTDVKQIPNVKSNIGGIATYVWNVSSNDRKYEIGSRYGVFRKNAEIPRKDAAQEFLQIVDGQSYKDEDSLAGELIDKLGILKSVHFEFNNFYNEYPHAKSLGDSLPSNGAIPRAARTMWVRVVCICYAGNGHGYRDGVDEGALPYYIKYIDGFSESEIIEFLRLMSDTEFTSAFSRSKVDKRVRKLANHLKSKTENIHIKRALDIIINAPEGVLDSIFGASNYQNSMKYVPKLS